MEKKREREEMEGSGKRGKKRWNNEVRVRT